MYKLHKRIFSVVMVAAMTFSIVPYDTYLWKVDNVEAAVSPMEPADNVFLNASIIPNSTLLRAIKKHVGGSETANVQLGQLRAYTESIDLSGYPEIDDITGLGYALKASSIDISKLKNLKYIYEDEFKNCAFKEFYMAPNVEEIRTGAFSGCSNLETIEFPDSVKKIYDRAFSGCSSIDGIEFPEYIEYIGAEAFANCTSIKEIVVPDHINAAIENSAAQETIGLGANVFNGCSSLKNIKLGAAMTAIPMGFLAETTSLAQIEIPKEIVNIRSAAFSGSGLRSIDISKNTGISVINKEVFAYCSNLSDVKLPNTITEIQEAAFFACGSLSDTRFLADLSNLVTIGEQAFRAIGAEEVTIPANVETIGWASFSKCLNLQKVAILDFDLSKVATSKVKKIGESAFEECERLESVTFPSVNQNSGKVTTEIGVKAFSHCVSLDNVTIPLNVTLIDDYAFEYCGDSYSDWNKLKTGRYEGTVYYTTESNLKKTQTGALSQVILYTSQLEEFCQPTTAYIDWSKCVTKSDSSHPIKIVVNDNTADGTKIHTQVVTGIKEIDLTNNRNTEFGVGVFQYCVNLRTVSLPDNMTEIPDKMFYNCTSDKLDGSGSKVNSSFDVRNIGLTTIYMPDSIVNIGVSAFDGCRALELNEKLPSRLQVIGASAFRNCERIGALVLPAALKYIGNNAFQNCSRTASFVERYYGLVECDATAARNLEYVGSNAFASCPFENFEMNVNAPVKTIGAGAFNGCHNLKTITFSNAVSYIGSTALAKCIELNTIILPDTCILDKGVFEGTFKVGSVMYYTNCAGGLRLSVKTQNVKISVRENGSALLPLYLLDAGGIAVYDDIIIGGYEYKWDEDLQIYDGDESNTNIFPELVKEKYTIPATSYTNETKKDILAVSLLGQKEGTDISIVASGLLEYTISSDVKITVNTSVRYTADVTKNPCKDIVVNDAYYLSYKNNSSVTITPKFIPQYDDGEISDVVEWSLDSGNVTITPSADGKSLTVKSKGSAGDARITVRAGSVSKSFYVYTKAPASGIKFSLNPASVDLMYGESTEISASLSYNSGDAGVAENHPDTITYTSSNTSVVQVVSVVETNGTTKCVLKGVGVGSAKVTVKAEASGKILDCVVNVSSDNIKTSISDADGKPINNGGAVNLIGKTKVSINYAFNEELNLNGLKYTVADPNVVTVEVDTKNRKVSFQGLKKGSSKVTLYPSVGSASNGVTINVNVNADVSSISLAKKTVELGKSDSVLSKIRNTFAQEWLPESGQPFTNITDNTIVFTSSDPSTVSVDGKGNVTVLRVPSVIAPVTITCSAMRGSTLIKSASTTVTPAYPSVSNVSTNANTVATVDQVIKIPFALYPSNGLYTDVSVSPVGTAHKEILKYQWDKKNLILTITGVKAGSVNFTVTVKNKVVVCTKNILVTIKSIPKPKKAKISKTKAGKKKVTVQWKKVTGASGYQLQMSTKKKKGYKNVKKATTKVKYTKKKLKSKKTYYFRVRAYVKSSSGKMIYGKWSTAKKVKVK